SASGARSLSMRAVLVDKPGPPDESMRLAHDVPVPQAAPGELLIQVAYTGLNRADLLQRMGRYNPPKGASNIMGLEVSGLVKQVGPGNVGMASRFRPGDRVMALLAGDAGALPEAWLTAYQLLSFVGSIRSGERVLVHAGASGVGTAALQLAKQLFGAVPFATAGSAEKCSLAVRLGAERCFNYREQPDWPAELLSATSSAGVNVLLDCVGAAHLGANARVLATDARWVLYGLMGGADLPPEQASSFLGALLSKRASLIATLLRNRPDEYKARLVSEFAERAMPLFESGRLRPVIDSEFPFAQVAAAHTKMQSNANLGKILLAVNPQLELEKRQEL
uniref:PKS_ER domain-containing protein n=1 Tax=Macrostomum lignano TaxID=282301 RepID=A0A1I8J6R7_9PLAT